MTITTITPLELKEQIREGRRIDLVDVRTPAEFREVHAKDARNVPLDRFDPHALMESRNGSSAETLYVICRTGNRAEQACRKLEAAGGGNIVNIEGGIIGWEQAGLAVVRGKKAISLERQVRIAAGFLVLFGAVLALTLDAWFALLPALIGGGLMFSGITDTCGMGLMLAKMPWNQVKEACRTTSDGCQMKTE
jgi:rhodanese-related sulfurtransferase